MATFTEIYAIASDPGFHQRVQTAMYKSALLIAGEALGAMTQAQTNKRQAMAISVLNGGGNIFSWSLAVANNATVQAAGVNATDGDIEFTISSIWDDMSGVTSTDLL